MVTKSEITVIIRSAGERTMDACYQLLNSIFAKEQIHMIEEVPFIKAILRSMEIGIEEKSPWFFCVDADVLIQDKGVLRLLEYASTAPEEVFEVQGLILDKFFPVRRPAGNHLYRTKYAEKALKMIPKEGTTLRPEATMLQNMSRAGYPWMQCDAVLGIHDFEQYYKDIFRKCFLQGKKHHYIIPHVLNHWLEYSKNDADYQVAIWGVLYSMLQKETILVDKRFNGDLASKVLDLAGIAEKKEFAALSSSYVSALLNNYDIHKWKDLQDIMMPPSLCNIVNYSANKKNNKPNLLSKGLYKMGNGFIGLGEQLRKIAIQ